MGCAFALHGQSFQKLWSQTIKHFFFIYFFFLFHLKKMMLHLPNLLPLISHSPNLHFHQQTNFAPNSTRTTFLRVVSPACFHSATHCLLRKQQFQHISMKDTPFRIEISVCIKVVIFLHVAKQAHHFQPLQKVIWHLLYSISTQNRLQHKYSIVCFKLRAFRVLGMYNFEQRY